MPLDISSIVLPAFVSLIVTIIAVIGTARGYLVPLLEGVLDQKLEQTDEMMKAAASSMGKASVDSRNLKKMEKMVIADIMGEYPEIQMILEQFSPETAEMIEEQPEMAMKLLMRYKPLIDSVLKRDPEAQGLEAFMF